MARVLLLEDHPETSRACRLLLEHDGHEVRAVARLDDALEICADAWPEVVVADLILPAAQGAGIVARLKIETDAPILAWSGYEWGCIEGAEVVSKTRPVDELLEWVRVMASTRRAVRKMDRALTALELNYGSHL